MSLKPGGGALASHAGNAGAAKGKGGRSKTVKEPITPDNLLLRGTVLRNTKVGRWLFLLLLLLLLLSY